MSAIEKLFPASPQERSFQLKARRDAGTAAPNWVPPQFVACKKCGRRATRQVWTKSLYVCPNCGVHLPIGAYYRLSTVLDHGTFKELNPDIAPNDVLHFPDYQEKLAAASVKTGLKEAAVTATGMIGGVQAVVAVLDSRFFMGSMSTAVGEKITRAIEYAADKRLPLIIFSASGGARMQEGIFSLMQMAKTSAALERFNRSGGLYVSVLTPPLPAESRPALPAWATLHWPNRVRSSALPGHVSLNRPSGKNCLMGFSAVSSNWNTALWTRSYRAPS